MHYPSFPKLCFTVFLGVILIASQVRANLLVKPDLLRATGALEVRDHIGSTIGFLNERAIKKFPPAKKGKCKHSRSITQLAKRTGIVELYESIKGAEMVKVGGTKRWKLDPKKTTALSTSEFYGCTVIVTVSGNEVVIGHYWEVTGGSDSCVTMEDEAAVKSKILDKLDSEYDFIDFDDKTVVYIIHSAPAASVGYKAIVTFLKEKDVKEHDIHSYLYRSSSGIGEYPGNPKGKVVVEWVSNQGDDGATLKVYIENDNPRYTQNYDAKGDPC